MQSYKDVFISYSRKNLAFASKLYQFLTAEGLNVWFDQNDIPLAVDFLREIEKSILLSHHFVFLLSPDSTRSAYCQKEIEYALAYGKRIIPVLCAPTADAEVGLLPAVIGRMNWVNAIAGDDPELKRVQSELPAVIRLYEEEALFHTQIIHRASEWKSAFYTNKHLLSGALRRKTKEWLLKSISETTKQGSQPTDLMCRYLCESLKKNALGITDVYIAYASSDTAARDWVISEFTRNGITCRVQDAPAGSGAESNARQGIEVSENVLLLLSPSWAASVHSREEIQYAAALNKRVLLLTVEPVDKLQLPACISGLPQVLFDDADERKRHTAAVRLIGQLNSEKQYYRSQCELFIQAHRWEKNDRNTSLLLRGRELAKAEEWLTVAGGSVQHPAPRLTVDFIRESAVANAAFSCEVFIASPQDETDFAEQLCHSLRLSGHSAIFASQDETVNQAVNNSCSREISGSDNLLLVLSSPSDSPAVSAAARLLGDYEGKRILLIVYGPAAVTDFPHAFHHIPAVHFNEGSTDFSTSLGHLLHLLTYDRDYIISHTRWLQAATAWQEGERNNELLPRGKILAEACLWLEDAELKAREPAPTALQKTFIQTAGKNQKDESELELRREAYLRELELENQHLKQSEEVLDRMGIVDRVSGEYETKTLPSLDNKTIGREEEKSAFTQLIAEIKEGKRRSLMVEGDGHSDKAFFLQEARAQLVHHDFLCLSCTIEEHSSSPFDAINDLADDLTAQLLRDELQMENLRQRLQQTTLENGRVLIELMPRLELLLGSQPPLPGLEPTQAFQRMLLTLGAFLNVIRPSGRPLAIVIENIQFANDGLLDIFSFLLSPGGGLTHFLILSSSSTGEARINERLQRNLASPGDTLHELVLNNLNREQLKQWLAGLFNLPELTAEDLAELLYEKTGGSPLPVKELLQFIYEEKQLAWSREKRMWTCDVASARQLPFTNMIQDRTVAIAATLTGDLRDVLAVSACIGISFKLKLATAIYETVFQRQFPDILPMVRDRLLLPVGDAYKLLSEDPAHAASSLDPQFRFASPLIPAAILRDYNPEMRQLIHMETGKFLLRNYKETASGGGIFHVASHFNEATDLLRGSKTRVMVAQINLGAAEDALQSGAYQSASEYLAKGIELMDAVDSAWEEHYALTFRLHYRYANTLVLKGNMELSSQEMEQLINKSKGLDDKISCYIAFCSALHSSGNSAKSLEKAREGLALLNIALPGDEASYSGETKELTGLLTQPGVIEKLQSMKEAEAQHLLIGELYRVYVVSVFFIEPHHLAWVCCRNLAHVFQYGYTPGARHAMAWFSMVLMMMGKRELSIAYATLAIEDSPKNKSPLLSREHTRIIAWSMSLAWKLPFEKTEEEMLDAFKQCLRNGDPQYSNYAISSVYIAKLMQADDVTALFRLCENWHSHIQRFAPMAFGHLQVRNTMLQRLIGIEAAYPVDIDKILSGYESTKNYTHTFQALLELARTSLIFNENENAFTFCKRIEPIKGAGAGGTLLLSFIYLHVYTICSARIYKVRVQDGQTLLAEQYAGQIEQFLEQLRGYSEFQPDNFEPYYHLAAAEWAAAKDEEEKAIPLYLRAAVHPRKYEYPMIRAMALEGLARFCNSKGYDFARTHAEKAVVLFAQCGANGKARQVEAWINATESFKQEISYSSGLKLLDENNLVRSLLVLSSCKEKTALFENTVCQLWELLRPKKIVFFGQDEDGHLQALALKQGAAVLLYPEEQPAADAAVLQSSVKGAQSKLIRAYLENNPRAAAYRENAAIALSIQSQGKFAGILYAEPSKGSFSPEQKKIISVIGEQAALLSLLY